MICWGPTDEHSWEMAEAGCSHEQNEDRDYDRDKEESGLEWETSDEGEEQDTLARAYRGVHDPNLDHVGRLSR